MTWWKGEHVASMTAERAKHARKEIVEWAKGYEEVTGGRITTAEAMQFLKTFDDLRGRP